MQHGTMHGSAWHVLGGMHVRGGNSQLAAVLVVLLVDSVGGCGAERAWRRQELVIVILAVLEVAPGLVLPWLVGEPSAGERGAKGAAMRGRPWD
jgi:hypothetical protein